MLDNKISNKIKLAKVYCFILQLQVLQFRDIKWSFVVCVWRGQCGCILQIMTHFTF